MGKLVFVMDYERKKTYWMRLFEIALAFAIIMFFVMTKQEDASTSAIVCAVLELVDIAVTFTCLVKTNIYNAKSKNMTAGEYLLDRFANAIPETKELFHIKDKNTHGITCPYCKSNNVKKITVISRAVSIGVAGAASGKIGKQWHCNSCESDF